MKTRFPGFARCMELMRKRDPQEQEDGYHWLLQHARGHVAELIAAFQQEQDQGLRCWLLDLIGEARSPEAMEVLATSLLGEDESLRSEAIRGLHALDTKQARRLLHEARSHTFPTREETDRFRGELARITGVAC